MNAKTKLKMLASITNPQNSMVPKQMLSKISVAFLNGLKYQSKNGLSALIRHKPNSGRQSNIAVTGYAISENIKLAFSSSLTSIIVAIPTNNAKGVDRLSTTLD